jgi:hypothetical protein
MMTMTTTMAMATMMMGSKGATYTQVVLLLPA